MAKRLQLRRGTTAETNTFTGAVGEVTVDTNKKTVVVHDGVTAGGFPVAAIANNDGTISLIKKDGTVITTISASGLFNNTLTSTATDQALTAAQGKVLQDNKLDKTANAVSASKLATARTINGVPFDGTANITVEDSTKVPLSGGTVSGNLNARALGINSTDGSGVGISLYGGASNGIPDFGIAFAYTSNYGTHGSVYGDWATYFTTTWGNNIGWIFRSAENGNVASISANGIITGNQFKLTENLGTCYITTGNGDAAAYSTHNMIIKSHWGIGFRDNLDVCRTVLDTRSGDFSTQGTVYASEVSTSGVRTSNFYSSTAFSFFGPDSSTSQRIKCNSILASHTWSDEPYVPHLGIFARGDIYTAGNISAWGNVTAYSDKRIKEDVTVIENALNKVEQLNGVTFKRKDTLDRQTGLLAQEVEAVIPEAVTRQKASEEIKAITGDEEVLAVNYGALVGLLVESIKELKLEIDALKEKVK